MILHLENIILQYPHTEIPAVAGVTLTLETGTIMGLLGPSGCGKTTLLRVIAGFERSQAGSVMIAGRLVAGRNTWIPAEQRQVGVVFQEYALFPHLTIAENIAFGLKAVSRSNQQQRVAQLLAIIELEGLEHRYPYELSGGQQQRVALARALAPQPRLILLDEPMSNLDVHVRLRLREELLEVLKTTETSAIFVTHDQQEALSIADQIAVMHQGKLEQIGTPEEIYTQPASRFVAEFVTQANFISAYRHGDYWETEVGCFDTTLPCLIHSSINSGVAELVIREEDWILQPDPDASVIVRTRHFLGREYRYCLETLSGRKIYARTSLDVALSPTTPVRLLINRL
ncbi:ABC transporter ATP-binding protein [Leptolyngbya sp. 'hensonii']|uniref:ABC transporter ATP-binding protein n=1 Tax=Leptolyngbya sp. 'hensonii' TaxID=1922337 RepID=UPI000AC4115C|nr:ABC transporter ATP-binding protein [Leptolyngbya sp. 'hensonii']